MESYDVHLYVSIDKEVTMHRKGYQLFRRRPSNMMKHHDYPLVITADIGSNCTVEKVIIYSGSLVSMLYYYAFIKMGQKREDLAPPKEAIYHFTNNTTLVAEVISLKTLIRFKKGLVSYTTQFIIVEVESTLNAILKLLFIHDIQVVPSSYHQCMRYLTNGTITTYMDNSWNLVSLTRKLPKSQG